MKKCKYCDTQISDEYVRCPNCNNAWLAGHYEGGEEMRDKFRAVYRKIESLITGTA